jgi:hypothetical protein
MAVWFNLWSFGTLFQFWYVWTKKNLATMVCKRFLDKKWLLFFLAKKLYPLHLILAFAKEWRRMFPYGRI